jgi:hypothetical protein
MKLVRKQLGVMAIVIVVAVGVYIGGHGDDRGAWMSKDFSGQIGRGVLAGLAARSV